MDLLQRLRPRWQHPDPDVRAAAVQELGADDQERLAAIAREDPEPRVRRIAIRKVDRADLLRTIAVGEADPALRDLAEERARAVLVGLASSSAGLAECEAAVALLTDERSLAAVAAGGAHESVRHAALARVQSDRLLRDVVRSGVDAAIRGAALERLGDPAMLRSIAVSDCPPELALQALARIDDAEALRVIAENRAAAKSVRQRAREVLAATAGEGATVAFKDGRARQLALSLTAEALSDERDRTLAATRMREVQQEWQELARYVPPREDTAARFAAACDLVLAGAASIARHRAAIEEAEIARQTGLAARRALCEGVERLEGADALHALADARTAWAQLSPVSDDESVTLSRRFTQAGEACAARHQRWLANEGQRADRVALVEEAEALATRMPLPAARRGRALEARWAALASSAPGEDVADLQRRFATAREQLARRQQEDEERQAELRQENLKRLESLSTRLQELATAETTSARAARRELRTVEATLRDLGPLPPSESRRTWAERLSTARDTLVGRLGKEEETEEWRLWANAGAQEEIIQRVERLLASDDLAEGTRQLARLQEEWAEVASATPDKAQALWDRFRAARNELRKRSDVYLAANLEKKRALCAQVADVGDSTAWNETADLLRRAQAEWKSIGPVPARHAGSLWKQFREPADRFFARRKEHWERVDAERQTNAQQKTTLCEQAEALADSKDWETTAASMKRLQAEWKRGGPLPRAQADALWQRFKTACDRFFDRRSRREEIAREETLNKVRTVCDELESLVTALAGADAPTSEAIAEKVNESWTEWRHLDVATSDDDRALSDRLLAAYRQIFVARPESLEGTRLDPAATLRRREKLCARVEELAAKATAEPRTLSLQEMALALRDKLATNTIGGAAASASGRRQAVEEVARIAASWMQLGPALDEAGRALEERFERARARVRRE